MRAFFKRLKENAKRSFLTLTDTAVFLLISWGLIGGIVINAVICTLRNIILSIGYLFNFWNREKVKTTHQEYILTTGVTV
jgi:hypothetical protein